MPKAVKDAETKNQGAVNLSFEEALRQLEAVVESMESGELPLETMLTKCEEGSRLSQLCQAKLAEAELKIQQLEKTAAGELELKPIALAEDNQET